MRPTEGNRMLILAEEAQKMHVSKGACVLVIIACCGIAIWNYFRNDRHD